jgi:4-alpha-glucanotransferase
MLRSNMAHAGALRVDHAIGLKRQFWIPVGGKPADGAYVRQPAADLLGILALESARSAALVIGEDLGTVPEGFAHLLKRWGVLSCQVLYFQRGHAGEFLPAHAYSDRALVTTTTHDHVSLAGFVEGTDLRIRRRVGDIANDAELEARLKTRARDVDLLQQRLHGEGIGSPGQDAAYTSEWTLPRRNGYDAEALCGDVHRFLARTPAPLVGIMLDDAAGETQPVNVPGVGPDRLRCWSRKMRLPLESIPDAPAARAAVQALKDRQ